MLLGQAERLTSDVDIWAPASQFQMQELQSIIKTIGIPFNPTDDDPETPYVRIVSPGLVQVPGWNEEKREWLGQTETAVWAGRNLTVVVPPPEAIVASKMLRGEENDFTDCAWIFLSKGLSADDVEEAIKHLPNKRREVATENLQVLNFMVNGSFPN